MNNIIELKAEKKKLLTKLKEKPIASKKAWVFASHYAYLDKSRMQMIVLISSFILGSVFSGFFGILGFFSPYLIWVGYDVYRMDDLINKHNEPVYKRLSEVDYLIDNHMKVKEAIGHTVKFLEKFNKKAS